MNRISTCIQRLTYNRQLPVKSLQIKIHLCYLRYNRQLQGPLSLDRLQILGNGSFILPPKISPNVKLPVKGKIGLQLRIIFLVTTTIIQVFTLAIQIKPNTRHHIGKGNPFGRHQLPNPCRCCQHILVVLQRLRNQPLQYRVGVERAPSNIRGYPLGHPPLIECRRNIQFRGAELSPHPTRIEAQNRY